MKKFLIGIEGFMESSGGIVALHKLCNDIIELGREAYITSRYSHPTLNAPFIGGKEMDKNEWVVIYPEIVHGNPYKFKHVVRWLLNTPGACAGVGKGFYEKKLDSDLVFKYSPFYQFEGKIDGILRCTYINYDVFKNTNQVRDIESAFLVKKGGMPKKMHPDSSVDFGPFQHSWESGAKMLNRCKYFYCYDNECFWIIIAALCGCIPIVIPNTKLTFEDWLNVFPYTKYGISFGLENIDHATNTISLVESHCKSLQQEEKEILKDFIDICDKLN